MRVPDGPDAGRPNTRAEAVWDRHGRDIHLLNNVAHLKILTLPYTAPNRSLTRRQREALEWVGDGKTMQDIICVSGSSCHHFSNWISIRLQS